MCDQCDKIDDSIARYKRLKDQINDKRTKEAADGLLAELGAKKAALHPRVSPPQLAATTSPDS